MTSVNCSPSLNCCQTAPSSPNNNIIPWLQKPVHKILFLGIGSCGKSTFLKSLNITNTDQNIDYFKEYCRYIRVNIVGSILILLVHSQKLYEFYTDDSVNEQKYGDDDIYNIRSTNKDLLKCYIDINNTDILSDIQTILTFRDNTFEEELNYNEMSKLAQSIENIWKLQAIKQTLKFSKQSAFTFVENMDYFLNKTKQIMMETWLPKQEDILKARIRTTGLIEHTVTNKDDYFHILELGGLRGERRKWIHLFERISCVVYTSALSGFCKVLFEDESRNDLMESMQLFQEVCSWKYFRKSDIVLLLTKTDIFRESLRISSLKICFGNEYKGRSFNDALMNKNDFETNLKLINSLMLILFHNDDMMIPMDIINIVSIYVDLSEWWLNLCYEDGVKFIKQAFLSLNKNPNKTIHVLEVCGIIPQQVKQTMDQIYNIVTETNLFYNANVL